MSQPAWDHVDRYFDKALVRADEPLAAVVAAATTAGLPEIAVSPTQGKLLHLLARAIGARRILEVGTLGGYSGSWLARALPGDGRLVTLEIDPHHAEVAAANFAATGVGDRVDLRVGPALDTLRSMTPEGDGPFDLAFIDADKANNQGYAAEALRLGRPGGLIVVDNVVRAGAVADPSTVDSSALGVRRLVEWLADEPRLDATAVQTVGQKGWDGLVVAVIAPAG